VCEEPVVSVKSGLVYEKRLILKALKETGIDPVTKEELRPEDLVALKVDATVKPRLPTATSVPSLIQLFANEWDAVMLESFNLKQSLQTLKEELAHTLYRYDASCRVIARLIKERDEARAALNNTQGNIAAALSTAPAGQPPMEVDKVSTAGINEEITKRMGDTAKQLSKNRKKVNKDAVASVAPVDKIGSLAVRSSNPLHSPSQPGIYAVDVHPGDCSIVATGGADGNVILFNHSTGKILDTLRSHKKRVTDVKFHPQPDRNIVFSTAQDHTTTIWSRQAAEGKFAVGATLTEHQDAVIGVTVHPCGDYFVTASADRTWAFYDLETASCRRQVSDEKVDAGFTRVQFHPDGLILGTGSVDSLVRMYDVKSQKNVCTFKGHTGRVTGLTFSENGYHLASADESGVVKLWDLRKLENFQTIQDPNLSLCRDLVFDHSGSYLAAVGNNVTIFSSKTWQPVGSYSEHSDEVTSAKFAPDAQFLVSVSKDRTLKVLA